MIGGEPILFADEIQLSGSGPVMDKSELAVGTDPQTSAPVTDHRPDENARQFSERLLLQPLPFRIKGDQPRIGSQPDGIVLHPDCVDSGIIQPRKQVDIREAVLGQLHNTTPGGGYPEVPLMIQEDVLYGAFDWSMLQSLEAACSVQPTDAIATADPQPVVLRQQAVDAGDARNRKTFPVRNRLFCRTAQDLRALRSAPEHSGTQGIRIDAADVSPDLLRGPPVCDGSVSQREGVSVHSHAVDRPGAVTGEHHNGDRTQPFVQYGEHGARRLQDHKSADSGDIKGSVVVLTKAPDRIGGQAVFLPINRQNAPVQTGDAHFIGAHPQTTLPVYVEAHRAGNAGHNLKTLSVEAGQAAIAANVQEAVRRLRHDICLRVGKAGEIIVNCAGAFRLVAVAVLSGQRRKLRGNQTYQRKQKRRQTEKYSGSVHDPPPFPLEPQ